MLSQANKKPKSNRSYLPQHWIEQYEDLAQPTGGIQINLGRNQVITGEATADLDSTAGQSKWPYQIVPMEMDPACAILTLWSAVPGILALGALGANVHEQFATSNNPNNLFSLNLDTLLIDYSGNQPWILNLVSPEPAETATAYPVLTRDTTQDPRTIENIEASIVETFSLSGIGELANLCGVSRQALYDWRKPGARPEKDKIRRLYSLWYASRDWASAGFPPPAAQLHMPLLKNRSLYDYLSDAHLDTDAIAFIGHRLLVTSLG